MELKTTFNQVAGLYDKYRPSYPLEVIDYIIEQTHLPTNGKILDVGCGSGKATVLFAQRGYEVTGLDISPELLKIAEKKTSGLNVSYRLGSFEDADLEKEAYDLIISAQAFHWVDPQVGYTKANSLLKKGGAVALFWNLTDYDKSPIFTELKQLYIKYCKDFGTNTHPLNKHYTKAEEAKKLGGFSNAEFKQFYWSNECSKEEGIKLVQTMSWFISMPDNEKEALTNKIRQVLQKVPSGNITIPYKLDLILLYK